MKREILSTSLSIFSLSVAAVLCAEDAPQTPFKKEKIKEIPHVWLSGDLLLLKAQENGLTFANHPELISTGKNYAASTKISPHFEWNTGVKIDAGYQPRDLYFFATWTFIQNRAHGEKNTDGTRGFFPEMSLQKGVSSTDYATSGFIHWKLNTNLLDLGVIVPWKPASYFTLKSRIAARIASLNQKFDVKYGGGIFNKSVDHVTMKNNFFGGGLQVGVSPNFTLPKGFTILGEVAASALVGGFFVKQNEHYLNTSVFHSSENRVRIRWLLDAKAAINWQKELAYKSLIFSIQTGVEWHEFFKQNQLRYPHFQMKSRSIILRGGFISLCLAF